MATKSDTQNLSALVINRVASDAVFQDMIANDQVNPNELYLIEGDADTTYSISESGGVVTLTGSDGSTSTVNIPTATSDLNNDSGFITSSSVPSATSTSPKMDGTAAVGSETTWAKGDHVHPTDTSRAPTSHASSATTYGTGTGSNYGHLKLSDSTTSTSSTNGGIAATPAAVKAVADAIPSVPSASTTTPSMDGTASYGAGTTWARADHVHPTDTSRAPTSHATNATTYGAGTSTNYGHLKLSDSTSSTSSTNGGTAATPAAVKAAYDLANGKFTLPSQTGNSGKFLTTNGSSASWGTVSANAYSTTFTTNTWSSSKITVNASTHGCGTTPMVQVQVLNGSSYEVYYGFPSTGWTVSIDSSGNITLSVPSGSEFAGRLIVR